MKKWIKRNWNRFWNWLFPVIRTYPGIKKQLEDPDIIEWSPPINPDHYTVGIDPYDLNKAEPVVMPNPDSLTVEKIEEYVTEIFNRPPDPEERQVRLEHYCKKYDRIRMSAVPDLLCDECHIHKCEYGKMMSELMKEEIKNS